MIKGLILKKKKEAKNGSKNKVLLPSHNWRNLGGEKKKMNKGKPNFSTAQLQEISETLQMFQVLRLASPIAP